MEFRSCFHRLCLMVSLPASALFLTGCGGSGGETMLLPEEPQCYSGEQVFLTRSVNTVVNTVQYTEGTLTHWYNADFRDDALLMWSTHTRNTGDIRQGVEICFASNGVNENIEIFDAVGDRLWSTKTSNAGITKFSIQDNCEVVLADVNGDVLWTNNRRCKGSETLTLIKKSNERICFPPGTTPIENATAKFTLEENGSLVLYPLDPNGLPGAAAWRSHIGANTESRVCFEGKPSLGGEDAGNQNGNDNIMIWGKQRGQFPWISETKAEADKVEINENCNAVVLDDQGEIVWASNDNAHVCIN